MTVVPRNSEHNKTKTLQHNVQIALLGSPNCGKTTLFNRLTGAQQSTGNWPGVTVEQKSGYFKLNNQNFHLIDLPGVYSLELSDKCGLDEKVACNFLQCQPADLIINVVDATSLERQLFLTAQLLHMGLPVVVVLNRMDLLKERNLHIDVDKLSEQLHCPVIPISAYHNKGIDQLKQQIPQLLNHKVDLHFDLPEELHNSVHTIRDLQKQDAPQPINESCWKTLQLLIHPHTADLGLQSFCTAEKQRLQEFYDEDLALIAADLYFQFAHDAAHASQVHTDQFTRNTTDSIDKWALHPIWGLPIFFAVMYLLFALSIAVGNVFIDFFDLGAQAFFVDGAAQLMHNIGLPEWAIVLIANGIGGGIQVVATFIPVIGALYLLLSILEDTGYMQRAALIMDNFMRKLGLSGQAFVPLVIGFGCNIPAVLASRTLPAQQDRIKTVMMTPFMSCSARLTVYVMFATAFFENNAALIVFSLYFIGILAAVLTAWVLKKTLIGGEAPPLLMELPIYHKPTVLNVLLNTRNRLKSFILDAGKIIILVVLALNVLNSLGTDGSFGHENQETSVLSSIAKTATPIVEPLGVTEENWPATVGLFTGLLAKEVVVGSLDALYQQQTVDLSEDQHFDLAAALLEAWQTVPDNLTGIFGDISDPLGLQSIESVSDKQAIASEQGFSLSTLDKMVSAFDGSVGAYAYLLLVLLYFPCVATFGAIKQELGWRWALTSGAWSLFLGYAVAVSFYQIATFTQHPSSSTVWLLIFSAIFAAIWFTLKYLGSRYRGDKGVKHDSIRT
ncbi:Fe(2+) transporter permease subunit FeoB [Thiomicrorhabdus sp. 6S2-11]|uniref:Ferrous iron transport protein B n=1 Tax=Thiomicrorhabdus marina TaxID=2818442 RepID=A0ABS3Q3J2_9GAMM|nr:Fe(2+) transporter permease subunit FeoB [Thiomicrorhabdus marina]MBO1926908.1 Fe(2+) transporter permease subunit FeoB [Thiomicrorhabdus marina]